MAALSRRLDVPGNRKAPFARIACVLAAIAVLCAAAPSRAQVTQTDVLVAARALSFMETSPRGAVRVGILYAPEKPESVREAEELRGILDGGLKAGRMELVPQLVRFDDAATANADVYFATGSLSAEEAGAASRVTNAPCVTTDFEHVKSGACVMGVQSTPRVQIVVNRSVAETAGIRFAMVFRVMIEEI